MLRPSILVLAASLVAPAILSQAAPRDERFLTDRRSPVQLPLPVEDDAFTFAVFGDRTGGPAAGIAVLADAVTATNVIRPDLVMTVGDMVQGYNQTREWLLQAAEYKATMDRLAMPWFPVAGNHDVYWRGPDRPPLEHEGNYEMHFGPLWYAFEHKGCWFVALYSDETNPETGRKDFGNVANHRMSREQFGWLRGVLERTRGARHVFLFLHHPRWIGGRYGDSWEAVHELLKQQGNVTAVFAGHIHRMRYDGERDGIEYFTLATTGGGQSGIAPEAGYLHHFDLVTVRDAGISVATLPVGTVMDPRLVTGEVSDAVAKLAEELFGGATAEIALDSRFGVRGGSLAVRLRNPVGGPVEAVVLPDSKDPRWRFTPDHRHVPIPPGEERTLRFRVDRDAEGIDGAFDLPVLRLRAEYLAEGARFALPEAERPIAVVLPELPAPPAPEIEHALDVRGADDCVSIAHDDLELPDGPFTVETWANARSFGQRVGLVAKTENCEFGFFVSGGRPSFSVHLGGRYVAAAPEDLELPTGQWFHLAGTFDGGAVRLFVDGRLVAEAEGEGKRTRRSLPLIVGADVGRDGASTSPFDGLVDEVRVSTGVRYTEPFTPARRHSADEATVLLLHMDANVGPFVFDASPRRAHGRRHGDARVVPIGSGD